MDDYSDSTDRKPTDYVLFALGFAGFIFGVAGVIIGSRFLTVLGGGMLLLAIFSFRLRESH